MATVLCDRNLDYIISEYRVKDVLYESNDNLRFNNGAKSLKLRTLLYLPTKTQIRMHYHNKMLR